MALDDVSRQLERITQCFDRAGVRYALVGGQAVALWVATVDPAAVRTTKDVDILLDRSHLSAARSAAKSVAMDYFETMGVGMFVDHDDPNPKRGVYIVWAGEMVRPHEPVPAPSLDHCQILPGGRRVVSLPKLVEMKLTAFRDHVVLQTVTWSTSTCPRNSTVTLRIWVNRSWSAKARRNSSSFVMPYRLP